MSESKGGISQQTEEQDQNSAQTEHFKGTQEPT